MNDDSSNVPVSFDFNYGVVMPPTFSGVKIIASDHIPDEKAIVMGGETVMSSKAFAALQVALATSGASTEKALAAVKNMGEILSSKIDDQMREIAAATAADPEQTEMERSPLWGAF